MIRGIIIGNLVRDPSLKSTDSGKQYCHFSVASNRGAGENKETDFVDVTAWGKTAEFVSGYFTKGKGIIVFGEIKTRKYSGKDGSSKTAVECEASSCMFLEQKQPREEDKPEFDPVGLDESDLPF